MKDETKLLLSTEYPHELLIQIGKIVRRDGRAILRNQEKMIRAYCASFPKDEENLSKLQVAYEQGVIAGFFEKNQRALWEKHIFLKMSMIRLEQLLGEKSAVQILESLMHVFQWNFQLYVERTWKKTEESFDFHTSHQIHRASMNLREYIAPEEDKSENHIEESLSEKGEIYTDDGMKRKNKHKPSRQLYEKHAENTKPEKEEAKRAKKASENANVQTECSQIPQKIKFEDKMSLHQRKVAKKAQKGKADAQCEMGDFYFEEGTEHLDYLEAERWYRLSSKQGYVKARFQLGQIYNKGKGSVENPKRKALECFRQLADENYPTAQCIMGVKYQIGDGVEMDLKKAIGYFQRAARQNHIEAQRRLGDIYMGMGNEEQAFRWYCSAAKQGDLHSAAQLKRFI